MRIDDLPYIMVRCLILTILIELLVAVIIGIKNKKDLLNVVLVNIFTNPLVVSIPILVRIKMGYNSQVISLIILELFAFISEGFIYSKTLKYKKINPYLISLILNLSSYLIGELINKL